MFTAGVIDVLMEAGVSFDGAIGVSAGAVFGCNYKSRQIGRVIRYNKAYCQDPRYVSFRSLLKTGDIWRAVLLSRAARPAGSLRCENLCGKSRISMWSARTRTPEKRFITTA